MGEHGKRMMNLKTARAAQPAPAEVEVLRGAPVLSPSFFRPVFAGCLADINEVRRSEGRPPLTSRQMQALEPIAFSVWLDVWRHLAASTAALPSFDRPGAVKNDASARLQVVSEKIIQRIMPISEAWR